VTEKKLVLALMEDQLQPWMKRSDACIMETQTQLWLGIKGACTWNA
jgi:hypothetical protein